MTPKDEFEFELRSKVASLFELGETTKYANKRVYLKATLFLSTAMFSYILILTYDAPFLLITAYSLFAISTLLLSINIGHEAIHNCLSHNKKINLIGSYTFYLAGVNPLIWKIKHLNAHHKYTNIPKLDSDFQQSELIRLDYNYPKSKLHAIQNFYIPLLYLLYTFHWTFIKDFKESKLLYTLSRSHLRLKSLIILVCTKLGYVLMTLVFPLVVHDYNINVVWGFLFSYVISGAFFGIFLIPIHINTYATIHSDKPQSRLSFREQLEATPNFSTSNPILNYILGGFNHHACHHLFPDISHIHYPKITEIIQKTSIKNGITYHNLTFFQLTKSHFRHLKNLAKSQ